MALASSLTVSVRGASRSSITESTVAASVAMAESLRSSEALAAPIKNKRRIRYNAKYLTFLVFIFIAP